MYDELQYQLGGPSGTANQARGSRLWAGGSAGQRAFAFVTDSSARRRFNKPIAESLNSSASMATSSFTNRRWAQPESHTFVLRYQLPKRECHAKVH